MGLDMYLTRQININNYNYLQDDKFNVQISVTRGGKPIHINVNKVTSIKEEIGSWRKANAIHSWFVKNVQNGQDDCGSYYVSRERLKNLMDACQSVLNNPSLKEETLPTSSGFFFGGTEYDDWYFDNLKKTVDICKECLLVGSDDELVDSFYYQSSW